MQKFTRKCTMYGQLISVFMKVNLQEENSKLSNTSFGCSHQFEATETKSRTN